MLRLHYFNTSLQALVRGLTFRALLPLAAAICLLFSILGPATDLLAGARQPADIVVRNSLFAGLVALGYAFGSLRRNYAVIAVTAIVQVGWLVISRRAPAEYQRLALEAVPDRLKLDATAILLLMVGSYGCFLWFMNGTAARYLRVRAEVDLAHQIHKVLVPPIAAAHGDFEFHGLSIPSGEVGGDLVDVVALHPDAWLPPSGGQDHSWFGYVADVSGHGVSSGVVMGMFKSALRMRLLQPGPLSALLEDLNTVLMPLKSGSMFVTVACVRGTADGALEYSVAGHLPILRVAAGSREVEEITTPQIPIGMFEDYRFVSSTLDCGRGDLLALITDGLTEVFDDADEQFGMEAVKAILARLSERPLTEISEAIVAAARAHGTQIDDQTLLLIRRG
jgi:serine phosphatase RsbU (regulator of sigma subunit)